MLIAMMLNLHFGRSLYRKNFNLTDKKRRVTELSGWWSTFDWTQKLLGNLEHELLKCVVWTWKFYICICMLYYGRSAMRPCIEQQSVPSLENGTLAYSMQWDHWAAEWPITLEWQTGTLHWVEWTAEWWEHTRGHFLARWMWRCYVI